jgi:hypothetical protein
MAFGREIKRLRGKISAVEASKLIGVSVDKLRKWEERDTDPSDEMDRIKIESFFGVSSLGELKKLNEFDFYSGEVYPTLTNVRVKKSDAQLEEERKLNVLIETQKSLIDALQHQNKDLQSKLDLSLGELRHSALLNRAISETTQDLVIRFLATQNKMTKKQQDDFSAEVGKENFAKYQKLKEEGNFAYVGK